MNKVTKDMTAEEAAQFLRTAAVAPAMLSQNWDNYEAICLDVIKAAWDVDTAMFFGIRFSGIEVFT